MKTALITFLCIFSLSIVAKAQCDIELKDKMKNEIFKNKTNGIYLVDRYVKNSRDRKAPKWEELTFVLNKGTNYKMILLSSDKYEGNGCIRVSDSKNQILKEMKSEPDRQVDFEFRVETSGQYKIEVSFDEGKKGCALFILTFMGKE